MQQANDADSNREMKTVKKDLNIHWREMLYDSAFNIERWIALHTKFIKWDAFISLQSEWNERKEKFALNSEPEVKRASFRCAQNFDKFCRLNFCCRLHREWCENMKNSATDIRWNADFIIYVFSRLYGRILSHLWGILHVAIHKKIPKASTLINQKVLKWNTAFMNDFAQTLNLFARDAKYLPWIDNRDVFGERAIWFTISRIC